MGARSQIQANEGVAKEHLLQREVMLNMCSTLHEQCFCSLQKLRDSKLTQWEHTMVLVWNL